MNEAALTKKIQDDYIIPATDIYENDNEYILTLEMPGISKHDIEITLENDYLEILGKAGNPELEGYRVVEREFHLGDYFRRFQVSNLIEKDKIDAKIEYGVLRLTLPKSEQVKPRKIEVKSE